MACSSKYACRVCGVADPDNHKRRLLHTSGVVPIVCDKYVIASYKCSYCFLLLLLQGLVAQLGRGKRALAAIMSRAILIDSYTTDNIVIIHVYANLRLPIHSWARDDSEIGCSPDHSSWRDTVSDLRLDRWAGTETSC